MQNADVGPRSSDPGLSFGLTGGIACGKSTVARYFQELGAYIIDADRVGHELIEPGSAAYREIVERFGKEILDPGGKIDRKKLGPKVFANRQQLQMLDSILHPRIIARVQELGAEQRRRDPHAVVIVDAALIFESGIGGTLRKVVVAWCRPEQQVERLIAKTGVSREEAERRIHAQMPVEEKRRRADYVIDCSGSMQDTRRQAEAIYLDLRQIAEGANDE
ncbi:MAG TPA: dephospho-CoA kinase [Terriglobia bacterium]|nr:dephospho-CoA kinase [Terriglobia bacterium]